MFCNTRHSSDNHSLTNLCGNVIPAEKRGLFFVLHCNPSESRMFAKNSSRGECAAQRKTGAKIAISPISASSALREIFSRGFSGTSKGIAQAQSAQRENLSILLRVTWRSAKWEGGISANVAAAHFLRTRGLARAAKAGIFPLCLTPRKHGSLLG
jgi:hypothetical protein